jgi:phage terminase large subunit-like protein
MKRFHKYIKEVQSGKEITGELIKKAVQRHISDIEAGKYIFDEERAEKAIKLIEYIRHWKGKTFAGKKLELEPFQVFYFGSIFGWMRKNGTRRFRTSYLEMARKNGKTSMAAGGCLVHILQDNEPGAQAYFVATKEEQARIGFEDTQKFIQKTPELNNLFRHLTKSTIYKMSFIKPLGSDSKTQDGFDPSWGVVDEYHAHRDDSMLNILESGMGARQQPMINVITTAGFNTSSACYNLRETSIKILNGTIKDDTLFAMIFSLDEEDDWKDENVWKKANPNLDVSVNRDFIRERINKAINQGGSKEVDVKTKNLNIWTDAADIWVSMDIVKNNQENFNPDELNGQPCTIGVDLAKGVDLCSVVCYFYETGHVVPFFWLPEDKVKNNKDRVDYLRWVQRGEVYTMPGNIVDFNIIGNKIKQLSIKYDVKAVGFDPYIAYHGLIQSLLEEGEINLVPISQGFKTISVPVNETEKRLYSHSFKINSEVLMWMFGNTMPKYDDNGNVKLVKGKSEKKIDGVVCLVMAVSQAMEQEMDTDYEEIDWDSV